MPEAGQRAAANRVVSGASRLGRCPKRASGGQTEDYLYNIPTEGPKKSIG
jgi:hypothetical protein